MTRHAGKRSDIHLLTALEVGHHPIDFGSLGELFLKSAIDRVTLPLHLGAVAQLVFAVKLDILADQAHVAKKLVLQADKSDPAVNAVTTVGLRIGI